MFEAALDEPTPARQWLDHPPTVTAVVVSHNGARWLPHALDALLTQEHPPDAVTAVDVASTDTSPDLLATRLPHSHLVRAPSGTAFGAAVRLALGEAPRTDWLWLLHDDCAPAPDALACLLDEATAADDVAVVGPKIREWPSLRRLLEVGVTLTGTGQRDTGLETGEPDQGQHDRPRDVLAVSSAGMLVRRETWDALEGFDAALPMFCDDIDFGWRASRAGQRVRVAPSAVLFHVEAGANELRADPLVGSVRRAQRRAALFTLLSNASPAGLLWQWFRLFGGTLLRALTLLVAKAPREAVDEVAALVAVYRRPFALCAARKRRARTSTEPASRVRSLLPHAFQPYQHGIDSLAELVVAVLRPSQAESTGRRAVHAGPGHVAAVDAAPRRRLLARFPWLVVLVALLVASVVAARGLVGPGALVGGALLPAPESAYDWWRLYVERSHAVGIGSSTAAPPYVLVLALLATVTWTQAGLVVDVLMLAAVPLAALAAHRFARTILRSRWVRIWWSVTYALLLPASGAVAQGRIGTVFALVVAPLIASSCVSLLTEPRWQPGVRAGLWIAIATAFAPLTYLLTAVPLLGLSVLLRARRSRGGWAWVMLPLLIPFAICGSWMWTRALDPRVWWWEAGRADAFVGVLDPSVVQLVLGRPDGPGAAPVWVGAGLLVAGVAALVRRDRRTQVLVAWSFALVALAFAVLGAGTTFVPPARGAAPVWVGLPLVLWLAALAAAAASAAEGGRAYLARRGFGIVQPLVAAVFASAVLAPAAAGLWWVVRGDAEPVERTAVADVPTYLAARADGGPGTLVVRGTQARGVSVEVYRGDGDRLGDESVSPQTGAAAALDQTVSDVLSNPAETDLAELAGYGIGAIYLPAPADEDIVTVLDSAPLLAPAGSPDPDSKVWTLPGADPSPVQPSSPNRPWIAAAHLAALAVTIVMAAPGRRRTTR